MELENIQYRLIEGRFLMISPTTGKPVKSYQERVINEAIGLNETIKGFLEFPNTLEYQELSEEEKDLIDTQVTSMNEYLLVLKERIALY